MLLGDGSLDLGAQLDLRAEHEVRAIVHQDEVRLRADWTVEVTRLALARTRTRTRTRAVHAYAGSALRGAYWPSVRCGAARTWLGSR